MKKLIVSFLFVCVTFFATAQDVINSYAIEVGYWNNYTEDWDWTPKKNCVISFIIQGDIIIANDLAQSTYYTYKEVGEDDFSACWEAIDEQRRECLVGLKLGKYCNYFIVIYPNICYRYTW